MADNQLIQRSALGRDGYLGDLYDACSDQFCGFNIFKKPLPNSLIQTQDTSNSVINYVYSDSLTEKFEKLHVDGGLRLSVLCKYIPLLSGSGQYLVESNKSEKCISCSLIFNVQTKSQKFNFLDADLLDLIDMEGLKHAKATHVVQKINWGGNATLTLEAKTDSIKNCQKIKAELEAHLKFIQLQIEGQYHSNVNDVDKNSGFHLRVAADVVPDGPLPQTVEEALKFMAKIPILLKDCNNGLGKPLVFFLMPLAEVKKVLQLSDASSSLLVRQINDDQILKYVSFFDRINQLQRRIFDRVETIRSRQVCLNRIHLESALKLQADILSYESSFREKLAKAVFDYRKGHTKLVNISGLNDIESFEKRFVDLQPALERIKRFEKITKLGASYLERDGSLDNELLAVPEAFVIYISEQFQKHDIDFYQQLSYFIELVETKKKAKMLVVDLDLLPNEKVKKTKIVHYRGGHIASEDYYNDSSNNGLNLMSIEEISYVTTKPNKRTALEIFCPLALKDGPCEYKNVIWHCRRCEEEIEYGFDDFFYCRCGKGPWNSYTYRCANKKHGIYSKFDEAVLRACLDQMRVTKSTNILVLGPTGVGKSTWLNSIINYLTFDGLEEARKSGPRIVIPVSFTVTDDNLTEQLIQFGVEGSDEVLSAGESGTQFPKTYSFPWNDTMVRIIDTPGIGDVRGLEKDKENLRNILDHVSHLDELHGICILLKPNEARLNVLFRFCVKELLANLHKSACNNIIFCFTNARSTFYKPGDTLPVLNSLLKELSVEVTLSKYTVYCLDNESFRFLCTLSYPNITYDQFERDSFIISWEKSVSETKRMFEHIKQLIPHRTTDTITLNEARRLILTLTKPMADITKNIELNISAIKNKKEEITRQKMSEIDLLKNLFIPVIVLQPKKLGYPRTVCTSPKCVEYRQLRDLKSKQILYKKHCHNRCYLENVTVESHPNVLLKNCKVMDANLNCKNCGCSWAKHMHISYEQELTEERVENKSIIEELSSNKSMQEAIEAKIKEMEERVKSLEDEKAKICEVSARFGHFLKHHAIAPYNDAMKAYLQLQIEEEENKVDPTDVDRKVLEALKEHMAHYEEEKLILESSMNSEFSETISASDVPVLIESLYRLPFSGECLRNTVEVSQQTTRRIISHNEQSLFLARHQIEVKTQSKNKGLIRGALSYIRGQIF